MRFAKCAKCREYNYIESDSLCPTCLDKDNIEYETSIKEGAKPVQNMLVFGESNSGTTFTTGLDIVRKRNKLDEDIVIVMIDPSNQFRAFTDELDGASVPYISKPMINNINIVDTVTRLDLSSQNDVGSTILNLVEKVGRFASQSDKKTLLYVDEAHHILHKRPRFQNRLVKILVQSKKLDLSVNLITSELPNAQVSTKFSIKRFHKHRLSDKGIINRFGLSNKEVKFIRNAKKGISNDCSEVLIRNSFRSDSKFASVKPRTKTEKKIKDNY